MGEVPEGGLSEFWFATVNGGVYHVYLDDTAPIVEKVEQFGAADSAVEIGERLNNGRLVAITKQSGVALYHPQHSGGKRCTAWATNTAYWGGHTSPIAGLSLTLEGALRAWSCTPAVLPWDWRNIRNTCEVLSRIPEDHPDFVIDEPVREMLRAVQELVQSVVDTIKASAG